MQLFAQSVVGDPQAQAVLLQQAQDGSLPAPLYALLFHYAYGKPVERIEHSGDTQKPVQVILHRAH